MKSARVRAAVILAAWLSAGAACDAPPGAQPATAPRSADASRVIYVGGSATEIIYALGAGERLVDTDTSSVYPDAATRLPQVGYMRQISSEGVLSLRPSLVVAAGESGPPTAIEQIRAANVNEARLRDRAPRARSDRRRAPVPEFVGRRTPARATGARAGANLGRASRRRPSPVVERADVEPRPRATTFDAGGRSTSAPVKARARSPYCMT